MTMCAIINHLGKACNPWFIQRSTSDTSPIPYPKQAMAALFGRCYNNRHLHSTLFRSEVPNAENILFFFNNHHFFSPAQLVLGLFTINDLLDNALALSARRCFRKEKVPMSTKMHPVRLERTTLTLEGDEIHLLLH